MIENITDLHMHIIPEIDDGSDNIEMSIDMLRKAYSQGVRTVFCVSHDWESVNMRNIYMTCFQKLRERIEAENIDIDLYSGTEIMCNDNTIDSILRRLNDGTILPLNGTRYVLVEFRPKEEYAEAQRSIGKLLKSGWKPIIAHAERCDRLSVHELTELYSLGCLIQINAYSLENEKKNHIKEKARKLLKGQVVTFIGSDAHTTYHRPPEYSAGIRYVLEHCKPEYAEAVLSQNADKLLIRQYSINLEE